MSAEVEEFLAELRPPVKRVALALREVVLGALGEADEKVDFGNRLLVFTLANADFPATVCELRPCRGYVELRFGEGTRIQDPAGLLAGTGPGLRHVRLETEEEATRSEVRALVAQAEELARSRVSTRAPSL